MGFMDLATFENARTTFWEVGRDGQRVLVGLIKVFMGLPKGCGLRAPTLVLSKDPFLKFFVGGALVYGVALIC